jgi:acetylornithine deacetylase/succinyl-diaminopimelate desuccinylase-like protein
VSLDSTLISFQAFSINNIGLNFFSLLDNPLNSPAKVTGKFSIRLVPDQNPTRIEQLVTQHLNNKFASLNSPNKIEVKMQHGARSWLSDPKHPNFAAAARATEKVYGASPDYTREGGSIPITSAFEEATKMNVCLLPVGACDDMAHSQNEKYNKRNLVNGIKVSLMLLSKFCHYVYLIYTITYLIFI